MFGWLKRRRIKRIRKELPEENVIDLVRVPGKIVLAKQQWSESASGKPLESLDVIFLPKKGPAVVLFYGADDDIFPPPTEEE